MLGTHIGTREIELRTNTHGPNGYTNELGNVVVSVRHANSIKLQAEPTLCANKSGEFRGLYEGLSCARDAEILETRGLSRPCNAIAMNLQAGT